MRRSSLSGLVIKGYYAANGQMDHCDEPILKVVRCGAGKNWVPGLMGLARSRPGYSERVRNRYLGGFQPEERVHPAEFPACKLQRRIQHRQTNTIFGLHSCWCMHILGAPKDEVTLVIRAVGI